MQRKTTLPLPLQPQQLYQASDLGQFEFQTTAGTKKKVIREKGEIMLRKTHIRRPIAVLLMLLGAALIFMASETSTGIVLLVFGLGVELLGITYKHKE